MEYITLSPELDTTGQVVAVVVDIPVLLVMVGLVVPEAAPVVLLSEQQVLLGIMLELLDQELEMVQLAAMPGQIQAAVVAVAVINHLAQVMLVGQVL
jgi:hypothetical protein